MILLGVLVSCRKVGENKARPNQVELERAGHVKDNVPPLVLLIIYIVTFYSIDALRSYLTCSWSCVTSRGHMPCRRRAVIDGGLNGTKRHRRGCRDIERGIGRSLRGGVTLDRAGRVGGLIPKVFVSCSSILSGEPLHLFFR